MRRCGCTGEVPVIFVEVGNRLSPVYTYVNPAMAAGALFLDELLSPGTVARAVRLGSHQR